MHTKDTMFADWLSWFTSADEHSPVGNQPFIIAPLIRAATDGRFAVVTAADGPARENVKPKYPDFLNKLLVEEPQQSVIVDADKLFAAIGECQHPTVDVCNRCHGTGKVPHMCGCDLCEADEEECEDCDNGKCEDYGIIRRGILWGKRFDLNRIAYILEHAPRQDIYRLDLVQEIDTKVLRIVTNAWTGFLVSLADQSSRLDSDPDWKSEVPNITDALLGVTHPEPLHFA